MKTILKILILEDSPTDFEIVKRLLTKEKSPCEFSLSINRETYVQALDLFKPDIILSDHSLPQFDSASALNLARQKLPNIPFIMVTGAVSEEFAADIIKLGADDYILKDRLNRLPSAIDSVLKQRKAEKEKKEADEKIIQSENNLRAIFENTSEGFLLIDRDGIVKACNHKMEEYIFWGGAKKIQLGDVIYDFIEESRKEIFKITVSKVLTGETIEYERFYDFKNGNIKWVDYSVTPVIDTGKVIGACITGRNITERKKSEQDLMQSELRLNEAQAIAHISNWEIDLANDVHTWSDELYRILGLNKNEVSPSIDLFLSFIHPDEAAGARKVVNDSLQHFTDSKIDFRFVPANGKKRYGHIEWRFDFDESGKPYRLFGILQDITERKEAEESLKLLEKRIQIQKLQEQRKIGRAIISGQEKERNHIGQELHDNINQLLAGSKMYLGTAGKKNKELFELIRYPMELIDTSINEIRLLCQKLVPPTKSIKLPELVKNLLLNLTENTDIKTYLTITVPDDLIKDDLKLNIYRMMQEQINNIQKYAEAKNVTIVIKNASKMISVIISDDGKGFNTNAKRKGIGLSNIQYRAESFNGKLSIKSSPGKGCKMSIKLPA